MAGQGRDGQGDKPKGRFAQDTSVYPTLQTIAENHPGRVFGNTNKHFFTETDEETKYPFDDRL